MKSLALILCLPAALTSCTTAQRAQVRQDAAWFFRHNSVSFTAFVENGQNKAGFTISTRPTGKRVMPTGK